MALPTLSDGADLPDVHPVPVAPVVHDRCHDQIDRNDDEYDDRDGRAQIGMIEEDIDPEEDNEREHDGHEYEQDAVTKVHRLLADRFQDMITVDGHPIPVDIEILVHVGTTDVWVKNIPPGWTRRL